MAHEDQVARSAGGCAKRDGGPTYQASPAVPNMDEVDRRNTTLMKELVDKIGWPTIPLVGSDGARSAWLLVQHADHDVEWQEYSLQLMEAHRATGQVSRADIAYLTDRVLVNQGKSQVYGTQFHSVGGVRKPRPIQNLEHVEERRKEMGLTTLEEYTKFLDT